jgi:hypothetical protein
LTPDLTISQDIEVGFFLVPDGDLNRVLNGLFHVCRAGVASP